MHVHADNDLGTLKLVEGVLDAIGDVGSYSDLGLREHIGGCCYLAAMFEQSLALLLVVAHVFVLIHHIETNQTAVQLLVSHQEGEAHQVVGIFGIAHGNEYLLIVGALLVLSLRQLLVS